MDRLTAASARIYALNDRLLDLFPHPIAVTVGDVGDAFAPLDRAVDQIAASIDAMETVHLHFAANTEKGKHDHA